MKHLVYKLTRDDGQEYIGTTMKSRFSARMCAHKNSERFSGHTFEHEILFSSDIREETLVKEEYYIQKYDTFENGLNNTSDGGGYQKNFTTYGRKYSDETKRKIGETTRARAASGILPMLGKTHTPEARERISKKNIDHWNELTNIENRPQTKLNRHIVAEIRRLYESRPHLEIAGVRCKNGKDMSYEQAFSLYYHKRYNCTVQNLRNIVTGKSWKNVQ